MTTFTRGGSRLATVTDRRPQTCIAFQYRTQGSPSGGQRLTNDLYFRFVPE